MISSTFLFTGQLARSLRCFSSVIHFLLFLENPKLPRAAFSIPAPPFAASVPARVKSDTSASQLSESARNGLHGMHFSLFMWRVIRQRAASLFVSASQPGVRKLDTCVDIQTFFRRGSGSGSPINSTAPRRTGSIPSWAFCTIEHFKWRGFYIARTGPKLTNSCRREEAIRRDGTERTGHNPRRIHCAGAILRPGKF